jgi:hypothetical protein
VLSAVSDLLAVEKLKPEIAGSLLLAALFLQEFGNCQRLFGRWLFGRMSSDHLSKMAQLRVKPQMMPSTCSAGKSPIPELYCFGSGSAAASGAATILNVCAVNIETVAIFALDLFKFPDATAERTTFDLRFWRGFFHAGGCLVG